jgi:D-alanine--poly(phosphoribitol) ligase subunit 2
MDELRSGVFDILTEVCGTDEVRRNPDLNLFDSGLLDSFGVVELLIQLETKLHRKVAITDFDRDTWNTANRIVGELMRA